MKKYRVILLTLLILLISLLVSLAYSDNPQETSVSFNLPSGVRIIDDEAFSGTAAEKVILQRNVEYIGDYAFSDNSALSDIYVPQTAGYIADNVFDCSDVTIHGIEGSYADEWAQEHGFRFVHEDIWLHVPRTNNLMEKLFRVFLLFEAVGLLVLLIDSLSKKWIERNRKRMKDYPELYVLDLVFP